MTLSINPCQPGRRTTLARGEVGRTTEGRRPLERYDRYRLKIVVFVFLCDGEVGKAIVGGQNPTFVGLVEGGPVGIAVRLFCNGY